MLVANTILKLDIGATSYRPSTGRLRQKNHCKLKGSLFYGEC